MEISGLRVLVTGGGRRIGRAIAAALGEGGAKVAVHHRTSAEGAEAAAAKSPGGFTLQADLSDVAACEALVERAKERLGGLDALVNNASVYRPHPLETLTESDWDQDLAVNLKGPFFCARAAGLAMRAAGRGVIVNLTDWAVGRPYPAYLPYFAAKAGLASLTNGLALALAPEVRVCAVAPGPILLPEIGPPSLEGAIRKATPLGRLGGPEAVVSAVLFLLRNDFMTGQTVTVDGGRSLR